MSVPAQGPTAQRFGSFPERGPSLWVWDSVTGESRLLLRVSGIEQISQPAYLDAQRVVYRRFHYPVYGRPSQARLWLVQPSVGSDEDLLPELPGAATGLALGEHGYAFLHSQGGEAFPFWYQLAVRLQEGRIHYPLPEAIRLTAETPAWSLAGVDRVLGYSSWRDPGTGARKRRGIMVVGMDGREPRVMSEPGGA